MFSTLKITTKPEMSNETLLPPCGWSFSITVETKMVTFMTAACRTGSMANADVQKQAINQHLLPFCGRKALSSHRTCSCTASRKGRHFMLSAADHQIKPEKPLSRWSTYSVLVHCGVLWLGVVRKKDKTGSYTRQVKNHRQTDEKL